MSVPSASESAINDEGNVLQSNSEPSASAINDDSNVVQSRSNFGQSEQDPSVLQARQRRRITQLEEKLQVLKSGRAVKERSVIFQLSCWFCGSFQQAYELLHGSWASNQMGYFSV